LLLLKFKDKYVFPTKIKHNRHSIGGGYVREPPRGLFNYVAVFDYHAMYPSIIKTFNLSRETIDNENYDFIINNVGWSLKRKSVLSVILDDLIKWRKYYKEQLKKYKPNTPEYNLYFTKQFACKFLVNTVYGVNAFPSFRLYEPRVADTITYIGRFINKTVGSMLENETGFKVIAGDTDSLFVWINKDDVETAKKIAVLLNKYTEKVVNKLSKGKVENFIKIDLEEIFDKVLFCAKKRYIGRIYYTDGQYVKEPYYKFVGVDIKRNNIPPLIKEGLKEFVDVLFNRGDVIKTILDYIRKIYYSQRIEDFMTPTKIEKEYKVNVPQQRAANFANKKWNLGFGPGRKFYSVYVKGVQGYDIIGFDNPKRVKDYIIYIDKDKYIKMFIDKVKLLYDVKNIDSLKETLFNKSIFDFV